jgi:hypothetical protein
VSVPTVATPDLRASAAARRGAGPGPGLASAAAGLISGLRVFNSGLGAGAAAAAILTVWILLWLGGFEYYRTAVAVRAYLPAHRLLRPSGPAGQMFGVVGALLMLMPFAYIARKRLPMLRNAGSVKTWLEVHLFCGVVGPLLVTFHTTFKFNGIVSAAYWSMVLVMLSGFVGRFLYVRIPRSIRGVELTRTELAARASELDEELTLAMPSDAVRHRLAAFERTIQPERLTLLNLLFGEFAIGWRVRALQRALATANLPAPLGERLVAVAVERALVVRRAAYLARTKKLFELWHVFHLPLVYLLLIIVAAHVGVALYLGYVPFRW